MEFWAQRVRSSVEDRSGWVVVDERYDVIDDVAEFLWVLQRGRGRSEGTARAYAGRLALHLTWAVEAGVDWRRPTPVELTGLMGWLGRTPSRKHRRGRRRRQAPPAATVTPCVRPARSAATVNGVLTAVVELLRYLGAYEIIDEVVAGRLSSPRRIRLIAGEAWGEAASQTDAGASVAPGYDRGRGS